MIIEVIPLHAVQKGDAVRARGEFHTVAKIENPPTPGITARRVLFTDGSALYVRLDEGVAVQRKEP